MQCGICQRLAGSFWREMISYHSTLFGDINFFIVSEIPNNKIEGAAVFNAMLNRRLGANAAITTVPVINAEDIGSRQESCHLS